MNGSLIFITAIILIVWLLTLGLGIFFAWVGVALRRGQFDERLQGAELFSASDRRAYAKKSAGLCFVSSLWFISLAFAVIALRLDRYSWLSLFALGNFLFVFGLQLIKKRNGINDS